MSAPSPGSAFSDGADILAASRDATTGAVLLQTGNVTDGTTEADRVELLQQPGLVSVPSNPAVGQSACQAFVVKTGNYDKCIAVRDLRGLALAGGLSAGETCLFAGGADGNAQARILLKANGNLALYTAQGNAVGGQSVTVQVNADGSIVHASPFGVLQLSSGGWTMISTAGAGAGLALTATSATLMGTQVALNGSTVALGSTPGSGVATQLSQTPLIMGLITLLGDLLTYIQGIQAVADSGNAVTPSLASAIGVYSTLLTSATIPASPVGFSTSVTASYP